MFETKERPDIIYLLHNTGDCGEDTWCTDPDPTGDFQESDATKYIRADRHPDRQLIEQLQAKIDELEEQIQDMGLEYKEALDRM